MRSQCPIVERAAPLPGERHAIRRAANSLALLAAILASALPTSPCVAANYVITDLGTNQFPQFDFPDKPWLAINNSGQIVVSGGNWAGARYTSGQWNYLNGAYFDNSPPRVFGIDSDGKALGGSFYPAGLGVFVATTVWNAGSALTTLVLPYGLNSAAYASNDNGQIVGGSDPFGYKNSQIANGTSSFASHAFLYDGGMLHDLGTLGGPYSLAYSINNSGRIVGISKLDGPPAYGVQAPTRAFFSDGGPMEDLNSLIGPTSWTLDAATAINDAGQVAGWGTIGGAMHAFLYGDGAVQDIGVLPGFDWSIGRGINAQGDAVGYSATGTLSYGYLTSTGDDRAFLYRNGVTYDLNSLIDPVSGWVVHGATDINDSGQIVGWGTLASDSHQYIHALLITSVPEPSTLLLAGLSLLALLGWSSRRGIVQVFSRATAFRVSRTAAVLLVWSMQCSLCAAASYSITDLGPAPAKAWLDINNNDEMVENVFGAYGRVYRNGVFTILPGQGDVFMSKVFSIDSTGNVSGGKLDMETGIFSTVRIWEPSGGTIDLGTPDGVTAAAFRRNDNGQIVGGADPIAYQARQFLDSNASFVSHAFLYEGGVYHDLGALGGRYSLAYDINNSGRIVGFSRTTVPSSAGADGPTHAFVSDGGPMQDLNSLIGPSNWTLAAAVAINDAGRVAGWGSINGQTHAFAYDAGQVEDIGILSGFTSSYARAINASGDIVGFAGTGTLTLERLVTSGPERAFLYKNRAMLDLTSLIAPTSGWVLNSATGINDQGQIVGYGTLTVGTTSTTHAFLMTPVPEPSTLVLGGLAVFALLGLACRRRRLCR